MSGALAYAAGQEGPNVFLMCS